MQKRAGFTLVEMLVSMALILFIMVILSSAFSTGLQVFRQLKGLGDMEERLRSTSQILRRDLAAYHFNGTRKLSDPNFWTVGPPQQGFFRIWQGSTSTLEGLDGDNLPSYRATNHMLHFTCKLSGQGQGDFATSDGLTLLNSILLLPIPPSQALAKAAAAAASMSTGADQRYQSPYQLVSAPGTPTGMQYGAPVQYRGRWYEVVYFMQPTGLSAGGSGAPLYTLYRRQLGVLDTPGVSNPTLASQLNSQSLVVTTGNDWAGYSEIASKKSSDIAVLHDPTGANGVTYPDTVRFSSPADLTMPVRRFGMLPGAPGGSTEMAGLPANPLLSAATAASLRLPVSNRTYPYLVQPLPTPPSPSTWSQPAAFLKPNFGNPPAWQSNSSLQGADLMLGSVISFDVQIIDTQSGTTAVDLPTTSSNLVFSNSIGPPAVFDTWSNQNDGTYDYSSSMSGTPSAVTVPLQLNILALKITIRVWDEKTLQARQITIIQDM